MQIEGVKIGGFFGGGLKRLTAEGAEGAEVLIRTHRRGAESTEI
ncbi:hypothetical protein AO498_13722 [Algoriphagus sanaruensis]|uniref:Uncharacterized protein n=1 Tax=Algoriphagus sanaruensis TaxID=1727163 RepID=A0A142EQU7_9BACT|nr:hypothetical protein AO498_13722 [Algoriphagus sanaruensis]